MAQAVMAIDQGTTSSRAILFGADEATGGFIEAVQTRPDLVNICHGEVGVCKN